MGVVVLARWRLGLGFRAGLCWVGFERVCVVVAWGFGMDCCWVFWEMRRGFRVCWEMRTGVTVVGKPVNEIHNELKKHKYDKNDFVGLETLRGGCIIRRGLW